MSLCPTVHLVSFCVILATLALFANADKNYAGIKNKYSEEANSPNVGKVSLTGATLDQERIFRVNKLNTFWKLANKHLRGEQKLKKLQSELKTLDKEVLKSKQLEGNVDSKKQIESRLHALLEKFSLPSGDFSLVFEHDPSDEPHVNSIHHHKDNLISGDQWQEEETEALWQRAIKLGHFSDDDLQQLRLDLEKLDHRLSKKRHWARQADEDKKNEDVKRRLKEITYKAEKQRKEIETRFFLGHEEL